MYFKFALHVWRITRLEKPWYGLDTSTHTHSFSMESLLLSAVQRKFFCVCACMCVFHIFLEAQTVFHRASKPCYTRLWRGQSVITFDLVHSKRQPSLPHLSSKNNFFPNCLQTNSGNRRGYLFHNYYYCNDNYFVIFLLSVMFSSIWAFFLQMLNKRSVFAVS